MHLRHVKKSSTFLVGLANPTIKGSQVFFYFISSISHILKRSKGRDKILGLIQNIADLYRQSMFDYLHIYRIKEWPISVKNANAVQLSMKNARKFFRLLRWVEEVGQLSKNLKKNIKPAVFLKIVRHVFGVFYYLLDNITWTIQIGILKESTNNYLDQFKDALSLTRYILRAIIFLLTAHSKASKESELILSLQNGNNINIRNNSQSHSIICSLLKARSHRRFQVIEMFINILRIIMHIKSLRLYGSSKISNVFYSTCGVTSGALALFKLLTHKSSPIIAL